TLRLSPCPSSSSICFVLLVRFHSHSRFFFFFQAEDGIRALYVTGVQTCALPISLRLGRIGAGPHGNREAALAGDAAHVHGQVDEVGRASCRERVEVWAGSRARETKRRSRAARRSRMESTGSHCRCSLSGGPQCAR